MSVQLPRTIQAKISIEFPKNDHQTVIEIVEQNMSWIKFQGQPTEQDELIKVRLFAWWVFDYYKLYFNRSHKPHGAMRPFEAEDEFDLRSAFANAINRAFFEMKGFDLFTPMDERIEVANKGE